MAIKSSHAVLPSSLFGTIYRPSVEVKFKVKGQDKWLDVPMIVDTGADYTILPRWLASDLQILLNADCERHSTSGIGGSETVFLCRKMAVRLGEWQQDIPVGFIDRDDVPALLGRKDFSEKFRLIFENHVTTFIVPRGKRHNAH